MRFNWTGSFCNYEEGRGYTLTPLPSDGKRKRWEFQLDKRTPLQFVGNDQTRWETDRHFVTDLGSIPAFLQWMFNPAEYTLAFLFHDSGCIHKGMFRKDASMAEFIFLPMTRAEIDGMLRDLIRAEGGSWLHAWQIYLGVRAYAICSGKR